MKRDMELIKKIVLAIESAPGGYPPNPLEIEGYTKDQIGYHSYLLVKDELAEGVDITTKESTGPEYYIRSLTPAGHEFAEAARDDKLWKKATKKVAEVGGDITVKLLSEMLTLYMRQKFGL